MQHFLQSLPTKLI